MKDPDDIESKIAEAIETGEWPDPDGPSDWDELRAAELGFNAHRAVYFDDDPEW